MIRFKNTPQEYGLIAKSFHWLMAILIIGLLIVGLYMVNLSLSPQKLKLFGLHKETGLLVLGLVFFRLAWRIITSPPSLNIPLWEKKAALSIHWALYALMFAMPLTGWLMSSAAGVPVSFFGLFIMPNLVAPNQEWKHVYADIHEWLAYALIAAIILHTLAALKHHFIDRDTILKRMLP